MGAWSEHKEVVRAPKPLSIFILLIPAPHFDSIIYRKKMWGVGSTEKIKREATMDTPNTQEMVQPSTPKLLLKGSKEEARRSWGRRYG